MIYGDLHNKFEQLLYFESTFFFTVSIRSLGVGNGNIYEGQTVIVLSVAAAS